MTDSSLSLPIRLLVVDDHQLFRRGLVALLSHDRRFSVVGEAGDATDALQAVQRLQPDAVLLDNHLPGVQGVDAIAGLKEAAPQARVLMLTVSENEADLAAGLRAGADGYLLKTIDTLELADSIVKVCEGDSVISPEMMGKLVGLLRQAPDAAPAGAAQSPRAGAAAPSSATAASGLSASGGRGQGDGAGNESEIHEGAARARRTDANPADPIHSLSPRESEILRLVAHGDSNKQIARSLDIAETTVKIHVQHILRKLDLSNRVHAAVYATERGMV